MQIKTISTFLDFLKEFYDKDNLENKAIYREILMVKSSWLITMKFSEHVHAPERIDPVIFGDLMAFPVVPPFTQISTLLI